MEFAWNNFLPSSKSQREERIPLAGVVTQFHSSGEEMEIEIYIAPQLPLSPPRAAKRAAEAEIPEVWRPLLQGIDNQSGSIMCSCDQGRRRTKANKSDKLKSPDSASTSAGNTMKKVFIRIMERRISGTRLWKSRPPRLMPD